MKSCLRALMLIVGCGASLAAQRTFDVGPLAGYYLPVGHFVDASIFSTSLPSVPSDLRGWAWGAAAHIGVGRRGVEAVFFVANSAVPKVIAPGGPRGPTPARETGATVLAQYDVSRTPEKYHF